MNDDIREQLSAYLDGALPEAARRDLEARLAASAELRGALEDIRAVSRAVKALPKAPLPPGFLARFHARRARGEEPRPDWVFLPPQARPVVAALSIGVVALAIWDKTIAPPEPEPLHPPVAAKVYAPANAPVAQLDLSRGGAASTAESLDIAGAAGSAEPVPRTAARPRVRGAAGRPIAAEETDRTRPAMTEEERSARNEEMFGQLEKQKKKMGIKLLAKGEAGENPEHLGFLGVREPPAAPALGAAAPSLLKSARGQGVAAVSAAQSAPPTSGLGRLAPDAALVFSDAQSLAASWVLLGLPGDPPAADFENARLVILKPSATKIISVTAAPDAVMVVYRSLLPDEESTPSRDRVAPLPLAPKTVLIYDASPR